MPTFKSGEVLISFPVQKTLRTSLKQIALDQNRTLAELMRDLVDGYVKSASQLEGNPQLSPVMRKGVMAQLHEDGASMDDLERMTDRQLMYTFQCNAVGQALNDLKSAIRAGVDTDDSN